MGCLKPRPTYETWLEEVVGEVCTLFTSCVSDYACVVYVNSSAGILYINPADLGWNPPVSSWIDSREVQSEKANLTILFDKYLPPCLETLRSR